MSLQFCTEKIRQKLGEDSSLNATLQFDCGQDGIIFVDAIVIPHVVSNESVEQAQVANCTIKLSLENLQAILTGELNPLSGFMSGKVKVEGDMSVLLRLQSLL